MRQHPVPRTILAATVAAFAVAGIAFVLGWQAGFLWAVSAGVPLALLCALASRRGCNVAMVPSPPLR